MSIIMSGDIGDTSEKLLDIMRTRNMRPEIFLFRGDLGSGKTTYIREIFSKAYKIEDATSPTYTLIDSYPDRHVYHMDLYRIEDLEDMFETGIEEILDDEKSRIFVEWPDRFMDFFDKYDYLLFDIRIDKETGKRMIEVYDNSSC